MRIIIIYYYWDLLLLAFHLEKLKQGSLGSEILQGSKF